MCVDFPAMTTDKTPEPYHRWAANEDWDVKAFSLKDKCLSCGVARYNPGPHSTSDTSNGVAAGPCPQKPWRELSVEQLLMARDAYRDDA